MRARTTTDLLADVRARVAAPDANGLLSSSEILSLCDQELAGEIAPLLILTKLEQFDYAGATAIALVMLTMSFLLLLTINALQNWSSRRLAG